MARVSVIIPVYNRAGYLAESIESVLGQELPADEIIVVDDGSTDRSAEVAEGFPVRVLRQANRGPGAARNAGARAATGEFLAFLDSDDLWEPAKLALQMACFGRIPGLDLTLTHVQNFYSPELTAAQRARIVCPPDAMPGMCPSTLLWRAAAYIPFAEHLAIGEMVPVLAGVQDRNLKMHMLPEVLVRRRLHETNLGRSCRKDYLTAAKEMLDRRRTGQS